MKEDLVLISVGVYVAELGFADCFLEGGAERMGFEMQFKD
jgi:hypothetical protein